MCIEVIKTFHLKSFFLTIQEDALSFLLMSTKVAFHIIRLMYFCSFIIFIIPKSINYSQLIPVRDSFCCSVVELREDVEYQVQFNAGERRMAIMVSLSPEFPLEKPVLRVSPPISHLWCNEHSEITSAPGLLNVRHIVLFATFVQTLNTMMPPISVYSAQ